MSYFSSLTKLDPTIAPDRSIYGDQYDLKIVDLEGRLIKAFAAVGGVSTTVGDSSDISATNTETVFSKTVSIPANSLVAGQHLSFHAVCKITGVYAVDTLALRLKMGGTTAVSRTGIVPTATDYFVLNAKFLIESTTSMICVDGQSVFGNTPNSYSLAPLGSSVVINTAILNSITMTAQWSSSNSSNHVVLKNLRYYIV